MFSSCQSLLCFSCYGEVPGLALTTSPLPAHHFASSLNLLTHHWTMETKVIQDWLEKTSLDSPLSEVKH